MEKQFEEGRERRYQELLDYLSQYESLAISFSGGIDSVFLAKAACNALTSRNVLALTSNSAIFPIRTINYANNAAKFLGIDHQLIDTDELSIPDIIKNDVDHCYHCKKNYLGKFQQLASDMGYSQLADGTNYDDIEGYSPGKIASEELGTIQPLATLGFDKREIRDIARWLGLPMWSQLVEPCLISRVTLGVPITAHLLASVQAGEYWLSKQGFYAPIVRIEHDNIVRIYVEKDDFDFFASEKTKSKALKIFRELGFERVTIDLEGISRTSSGFTSW